MVKRKNMMWIAICSMALFILWGLATGLNPARAVTQDAQVIALPEKDSYVNSGYGTSNYGGQQWFILGDYITDWTEAYFYFNCSARPAGWTKVEVWLDFYSVSETFSVTASQVTEAWGEYTITWINKPAYGPVLSTFTVAAEEVYEIDVTSIASGNNISLCVNASDYLQTGHIQGRAREGGSGDLFPAPRLVWTYPKEVSNRISGYDLGIVLGCLSASVLFVVFCHNREKKFRVNPA